MPYIKPSCIEVLRNSINIYDVVAPHVTLKKAGSKWRGLSPFNTEKTPSFYIDTEKNFYYCFSSGQGGDIFRFVQTIEKLNFNETVETLAHRFNLPIEYEHSPGQPPQTTSLHKEIREIHETASNFFHQNYTADSADAQTIRDYWTKERCFPPELATEFQLGWAPASDNRLLDALLKRGFSPEALFRCGLFYPPHNTAAHPISLRPRFRGRLIIPIRDVQGRTIAFAGRQTEFTPKEDPTYQAKYINSPETPIFAKNRVLFGLDRARQHIHDTQHFLLVEGPLDVLRCWQHKFRTAVAPQGTAVTAEQLACLRRYTDKVECLLDGDTAGQKAALRLIPLALSADLEVRFIPLPAGSDPDSFLSGTTPDQASALEVLRRKTLSPVAFALGLLLPNGLGPIGTSLSAKDKTRALDEIYRIIDHAHSVVARDEYRKEAARLLDCNPESLAQDFHAHPQTHAWPLRSAAEEDPAAAPRPPEPDVHPGKIQKKGRSRIQPLTTAEYELLCILLQYRQLGPLLAHTFDPDWIRKDGPYASLLKRLLAEFREEGWDNITDIDRLLEKDSEKNLVYEILSKDLYLENPLEKANSILKYLFKNYLKEQKHSIELLIDALPAEDFIKRQKLQQRIIELRSIHPPSLATTSHGR